MVPVIDGDFTCQLTIPTVNRAPFRLTSSRSAVNDWKASMDFDKDIEIFRAHGRTVTIPLWTSEELNCDTLSEHFTSSEKEYAENETDSESCSEQNHADKCGPIRKEYIVCF